LLSVREQGRLVPFSARFVSVASASESHLGLTARKTLIMPGTVRYGVDLSRLRRSSLAWDENSRTLQSPCRRSSCPARRSISTRSGNRPRAASSWRSPVREATLDRANRQDAQDELMRQARAAVPMSQARAAAMREVARAFALPLRAAGIEASVAVRFVDPAGREEAAWLDRPRRTEETLRDRSAR
jgi:hypothetical protein